MFDLCLIHMLSVWEFNALTIAKPYKANIDGNNDLGERKETNLIYVNIKLNVNNFIDFFSHISHYLNFISHINDIRLGLFKMNYAFNVA